MNNNGVIHELQAVRWRTHELRRSIYESRVQHQELWSDVFAELNHTLETLQVIAGLVDQPHAEPACAHQGLAIERQHVKEVQEALLRESEARAHLDALLAAAPVGIAFWDRELRCLRANDAFVEISGVPCPDHRTRTAAELLPAIEPLLRQVIETETSIESLEVSSEALAFPGKLRHYLASFYPVRGQDGQLLGIGAILREITEHKHLEAQFRQAQKIEGIGRLAGGIAHDFNNLLTAILGNTELALGQLAPGHPARSDLRAAQAAANRAASLTRQLLAFARKQILEPHVLNLNHLILEMDQLLRRLIGENIELVTLPDSNLAYVKVDPGQIEQVLVNLAINARDAMPNGGKLTIETSNIDLDAAHAYEHPDITPGRYVMLAVSDTGVGMEPAVQARLFEPFFTTKEPGQGTGLGLATCYGIVKQHGGHIWVYSEVGQGTTVKAYLPRTSEAAKDIPAHDAAELLPRGKETVLLAEDEPAVRQLAARVLRELGYTVLEASNGEEARRIATEYATAIELLLADVVMPQMGGKPLARWLACTYPSVKVLFMSGYTDNAIVHHGRLDPGIAFLQKPFSPMTLACKVREVLDA